MLDSTELKAPAKTEARTRTKRPTAELYSITEVDGEFEITLPGLEDPTTGMLVGTYTERFSDQATAEARINASKEQLRIAKERASLDKTYAANHFYNITQTPDGRFVVTVPGGVDDAGRFYLATTSFTFDRWDDAKAYFISTVEAGERVVDRPLLKLDVDQGTSIAFSELDAFHPTVAATETSYPIPAAIEQHLMSEGRLDGKALSAHTYQETIKEQGWESKLYTFVVQYLKQEGTDLARRLGIEALDALSPKQAVELATSLVVDLTKYKWSDTRAESGDLVVGKRSAADQQSVLQLLEEGLRRRSDPQWEGNGVCRNFASMVKAVFEAVKANQTQFSRLRNTYALFEQGNDSFAPEREDSGTLKTNQVGHVWNSFVTVGREGTANSVIVDATWAKRDLDTKQVVGLDHTLLRMEPVVRTVATAMSAETPQRTEQLQDILAYYVVKIEGHNEPSPELPPVDSLTSAERTYYRDLAIKHLDERYDLSQAAENTVITAGQKLSARLRHEQTRSKERTFFTGKTVEIMGKQGIPEVIPAGLVAAINEQYPGMVDVDRTEIETIYQLAQREPKINAQKIIAAYLKDARLSDYHADKLLFNDNQLQRVVYETLKTRPGFERFCKESPKFRVRLHEAIPELFLDFSPDTKPEDAAELRYLIGRAGGLRTVQSSLERSVAHKQSAAVFERIRSLLPHADLAGMSDYEMVRNFDVLAANVVR